MSVNWNGTVNFLPGHYLFFRQISFLLCEILHILIILLFLTVSEYSFKAKENEYIWANHSLWRHSGDSRIFQSPECISVTEPMATVQLGFVHTSTDVQHYYHISIFVHTQLMNKPLSGRVRELNGSVWSISSWGLCWLNNEKVISQHWLHPQASVRNTFCCWVKRVFELYINYLSNT